MPRRVEIYETDSEPAPRRRRWGAVLGLVGLTASVAVLHLGMHLLLSAGLLLLAVVGFLLNSGQNAQFRYFNDDED